MATSGGSKAVDVLIVGAGPVGLTMAAALDAQGLACRLVDKAPRPSDKSKALVVWSRTLELLDNLGASERFIATGMAARGVSVYGSSKRLVHIEIDDLASPFNYPLMIPQNETERLLTEYLAERGITVEREVELVAMADDGSAVRGTMRHGDGREEPFEVPWLVGCDGAHSAVRHALGLEFSGAAEQDDWMLADVHIEGPIAGDEISVYWHEQGILVFFPITPGRFRMIADLGRAADTPRPADPTPADVQAMIDQRGPGGLTACDPVWLAGFRINERKVSDYRVGRIMLAGDAAHIHSPAGGQGMNTGMQDAFNLAWKLALTHRGLARGEALLDSYSAERSRIGDQVLHAATKITHVAMLRNPVAQFVRNHTASVLGSLGIFRDKMKNTLSELAINYRGGPLSEESGRIKGGVPAGDRLPDARLADTRSGDETTLFRAIRGPRYTLLLLAGTGSSQEPARLEQIAEEIQRKFPGIVAPHVILPSGAAGMAQTTESKFAVWLDIDGTVHRQHAAREATLVLVRPDWYVGFRSQGADGETLAVYLGRFLRSDVPARNEGAQRAGCGGAEPAFYGTCRTNSTQ